MSRWTLNSSGTGLRSSRRQRQTAGQQLLNAGNDNFGEFGPAFRAALLTGQRVHAGAVLRAVPVSDSVFDDAEGIAHVCGGGGFHPLRDTTTKHFEVSSAAVQKCQSIP